MLPSINGQVSVYEINEDTSRRHILTQYNQIQYDWGAIATRCIGKGERNYRVSAMYIEFENVASPGNAVAIPTYERSEGRSYYQDLQDSVNRDFLRIPLLYEPSVRIQAGREDYFEEGLTGDVLRFAAQSQGSVGFHGKTFSAGTNSKVFGVALVATPVFSDPTQDLIFARTYFQTSEQLVVAASKSVGITWDVNFG